LGQASLPIDARPNGIHANTRIWAPTHGFNDLRVRFEMTLCVDALKGVVFLCRKDRSDCCAVDCRRRRRRNLNAHTRFPRGKILYGYLIHEVFRLCEILHFAAYSLKNLVIFSCDLEACIFSVECREGGVLILEFILLRFSRFPFSFLVFFKKNLLSLILRRNLICD